MPKSGSTGPSYAGLVDVSSPDTVTPEWAEPTVEVELEPAPKAAVSRETAAKAEPKPSPKKTGKS